MNLKHRLPLLFSLLFSLLLAFVMITVYGLYANFRKEEFKDRLAEKVENTVKLLLKVKEVDEQVLKIIDRASINRLYNEKTLIFDEHKQLIYSSIDDATIHWSPRELNELKQQKETFKESREYDVLGLYFEYAGKDYYALISAEDKYGRSKLDYLKVLLAGAFVTGTALVWLLSFSLSKRILKPLESLRKQMQEITTKNLTARVAEPKQDDEIKALSLSFNQMLDRIDTAYKNQKNFTSNASHELRTPITRIVMQLENLLKENTLPDRLQNTLTSISEDTYRLSDIVASLLLLSNVEENDLRTAFKALRLDEIIFESASRISGLYPDMKIQFEVENLSPHEPDMEIKGDETLLKIVFVNLFKNAYQYSDNRVVQCLLRQQSGSLQVVMTNQGETPAVEDPNLLFHPFSRGSNTKNKPGSGIGLSIVQRILHYHGASVAYTIPAPGINELLLSFPLPLI